MTFPLVLGAISLLTFATLASASARGDSTETIYIGTYTRGSSKGIYRLQLNPATGEFVGHPAVVAESKNPEFLAISADASRLYAGNSARGNAPRPQDASIDAFALSAGNAVLKRLNQVPCGGDGGTYLQLDRAGANLLVVSYGAATVAMLPINADGSLQPPSVVVHHQGSSVNHSRQAEAHPHSVTISPSGKFAYVPDLGCDKIYAYAVDSAAHTLSPADPPFVATPPGSGPRRISFTRDGRFAYAIMEMGNTTLAYRCDPSTGRLSQIQQVSNLPSGVTVTDTGAEIDLGPADRFVYASNRGHDSIVVFERDPTAGTLKPVGWCPTGGKTPRHFAIDPSGRWLVAANQDSASVKVLKINSATGALSPGPGSAAIDKPVCVLFVTPAALK